MFCPWSLIPFSCYLIRLGAVLFIGYLCVFVPILAFIYVFANTDAATVIDMCVSSSCCSLHLCFVVGLVSIVLYCFMIPLYSFLWEVTLPLNRSKLVSEDAEPVFEEEWGGQGFSKDICSLVFGWHVFDGYCASDVGTEMVILDVQMFCPWAHFWTFC